MLIDLINKCKQKQNYNTCYQYIKFIKRNIHAYNICSFQPYNNNKQTCIDETYKKIKLFEHYIKKID